MDVTVQIQAEACGHVNIIYTSGSKSLRRRYTLAELKEALQPDSIEEAEFMIMAQMKKIILENPSATKAQIKSLLEAQVYKI